MKNITYNLLYRLFSERRLIMLYLSAIMSAGMVMSAKTQFKVSLDSAYIMMGRVTGLNLQIIDTSDQPGTIVVQRDSFPKEVEFVGDSIPGLNINKLENGANELTAKYILQSFNSGAYRLPPFIYVNGKDTVVSNSVTLKVIPVDVSGLADANPNEPTVDLPSRWYDWIPDIITDYWLYALLTIIIIAGGICAYKLTKKGFVSRLIPAKKIEPPYDEAMRRLAQLKEAQLWEKGQEKLFYTDLTDILRNYLNRRFGINAKEMTSSQIMRAVRCNEETKLSDSLMAQVLEIADYVKFAKMTPLREDNIKSFDAALQFVEDTKPLPVENTDSVKTRPEQSSGNN